jgi:thioredoxin-dependent peroxiredoxin
MATTHLNGAPVETSSDLPAVGDQAPAFELTDADLGDVTLADFAGRQVLLNIFPSIDTGVCALSVRTFNARAASLPNTTVVCVSMDLPFALARFCAAEGIADVITASAFRSSFGDDYGVIQVTGPLRGLLARSVVLIGTDGNVRYAELVDEISSEPNYEAALAALS